MTQTLTATFKAIKKEIEKINADNWRSHSSIIGDCFRQAEEAASKIDHKAAQELCGYKLEDIVSDLKDADSHIKEQSLLTTYNADNGHDPEWQISHFLEQSGEVRAYILKAIAELLETLPAEEDEDKAVKRCSWESFSAMGQQYFKCQTCGAKDWTGDDASNPDHKCKGAQTYTAPTGPHTLSGSMLDDKTTINGHTYTNYDGTFSEAQPVIQRYLDALGWGEVASENDITWGLSEEEWLVRDERGRCCVIDTHDDTITY